MLDMKPYENPMTPLPDVCTSEPECYRGFQEIGVNEAADRSAGQLEQRLIRTLKTDTLISLCVSRPIVLEPSWPGLPLVKPPNYCSQKPTLAGPRQKTASTEIIKTKRLRSDTLHSQVSWILLTLPAKRDNISSLG